MSCLFRSLSAFVNSIEENELRQNICNYLEQNPKIMDDLSLKDLLHVDGVETFDYVHNMRHPSTWGSAIEIRAFCEIYQIGVVVKILPTGREVIFKPFSMEKAEYISAIMIEWTGNHYEPVFKRNSQREN